MRENSASRGEESMEVIMATNNEGKVREVREILKDTGIEILSLKEAGIDIDIEETGDSFEVNAAIKAETVRDLTNRVTIADDSGLSIDFLDGAPGIYSSRFMGEDTSYDIKNAAILEKMKDVPEDKRGARFICAMAIARPDSFTEIFNGVFEGRIAWEASGVNGFGYDPIFYVPEMGCTSAELEADVKNAMSHRGKALRQAVEELKRMI